MFHFGYLGSNLLFENSKLSFQRSVDFQIFLKFRRRLRQTHQCVVVYVGGFLKPFFNFEESLHGGSSFIVHRFTKRSLVTLLQCWSDLVVELKDNFVDGSTELAKEGGHQSQLALKNLLLSFVEQVKDESWNGKWYYLNVCRIQNLKFFDSTMLRTWYFCPFVFKNNFKLDVESRMVWALKLMYSLTDYQSKMMIIIKTTISLEKVNWGITKLSHSATSTVNVKVKKLYNIYWRWAKFYWMWELMEK